MSTHMDFPYPTFMVIDPYISALERAILSQKFSIEIDCNETWKFKLNFY